MAATATTVFVDTAALVALLNRDDSLHDRAVGVRDALASNRSRLVISHWIFTELLGLAAGKAWRAAALNALERFAESRLTTVVAVSEASWREGLALYQGRSDKAWSLVDCISMTICRREGITSVFTHDHHFAQGGFKVLLR